MTLRTDSFKYFYIKVIGILILAKILFMFSAGMMAYLRGVGMIQHIEELFYNVQNCMPVYGVICTCFSLKDEAFLYFVAVCHTLVIFVISVFRHETIA